MRAADAPADDAPPDDDHAVGERTGGRSASAVAVSLFIVAVAYGAAAHGGFKPVPQRLLLAGAGASACVALWSTPRAARWWAPMVAVALLGGWSVVAAAAAGDVAGAAPVLGILFGVGSAALVGWTAGDQRELLVDALLLIGAGVAVLGWAGVVLRINPVAMVETGLWRAASTLTYENATAALLAPLAVVALARAAARPERAADRVLAMTLVVGVGATLSRAGWAGLATALVVLALSMPWPRLGAVAVPVLAGAAVAVAGVVAVTPAGDHRSPAVPILAAAAGVAICMAPVPWRRAVAVATVVGGLGLVAAVVVAGPGAGGFRASRLSVDSPDRANEWRATAAVARRHLWTGVGPSHLTIAWRDSRGEVIAAKETHNEYLQLAAEEGVVAAALAVAVLGVAAWALRRRVRDTGGDWLAAGALAAVAGFAVHSAFDFVWHVPVVPIVVAALAGAAFVGPAAHRLPRDP